MKAQKMLIVHCCKHYEKNTCNSFEVNVFFFPSFIWHVEGLTFINYFLLFKGARWVVLGVYFDYSGGGGAPLFIYFDFFYCWAEGVQVNVFFSPSFDMCKEEGKRGGGFFFFLNFFFIV
jgi:hypothetical protein